MPDYSKHHEQAGRIGGLVRASRKTNEQHRIERSKAGFMARFLAEVPEHITDPVERQQMANLGMRAHMSRIAMKSAEARRKPATKKAA